MKLSAMQELELLRALLHPQARWGDGQGRLWRCPKHTAVALYRLHLCEEPAKDIEPGEWTAVLTQRGQREALYIRDAVNKKDRT